MGECGAGNIACWTKGMGHDYRLVELGNSELLAGLSELVQQSNALIARVLAHLVELEQRMLHLELGFSSLFAYCVEALRMSEGSAGRRVAAARVCRRFPEALERVARSELHLCALCALPPHLNDENATELFEACRGKTRRQIEELLAARFPRPDVREQIRRLPAPGPVRVEAVSQPLQTPRVFDALGDGRSVEGPSLPAAAPGSADVTINSAPPSFQARPLDTPPRARGREIEPLSAARFGVHFTADAELRELIERARALASHRRMSVEAVLWWRRTGVPWRDLPVEFGPWKTVFNRFDRGSKRGTGENQKI